MEVEESCHMAQGGGPKHNFFHRFANCRHKKTPYWRFLTRMMLISNTTWNKKGFSVILQINLHPYFIGRPEKIYYGGYCAIQRCSARNLIENIINQLHLNKFMGSFSLSGRQKSGTWWLDGGNIFSFLWCISIWPGKSCWGIPNYWCCPPSSKLHVYHLHS